MRADTSPARPPSSQGEGRGDWRKALLHPVIKPLLFCAALLPAVWLVVAAATNQLGANPAEALIRSTGDWALRALCVVLALTPLRVAFAVPALARWRRMLGLFAFFYAFLHVLSYSWLDMGLDPPEIFADIVKRPFILVGTLAFVVLLALAATSFQRAIRALGSKRWQALHRTVYAAALLAVLHFFWMRAGKNDFAEVAPYAAIIVALLGWRLWRRLKG
ncbi:protein-methionine-sulfoxide reductase heme-binding subunit MsrQ [Acidovorax temperans]|uniref:sulfite oxidase heme-binding subunit YedZ n=1 Tax=Acidovorax temperans TaxID=80878 RepID=UPI0028995513|nr:protein-methionine-sulfoxide reductase heme-binding subunit MsrQ [Acidovorax temperans]